MIGLQEKNPVYSQNNANKKNESKLQTNVETDSLPENGVIFLTLLISNRDYIPYTDLRKKSVNYAKNNRKI